MHEHSEKRLFLRGLLAACLLAGCRPLTDEADGGPDAEVKDDPVQSDENGPLVSVLAPLEGTDPNAGEVLVQPQIEVRCGASARNAGRPVNPGSVKVRVFAAGESKPALTLQALARGNDAYAAEISLLELPAGRLRIECSARDVGPNARGGLASIETLFDTGPQVVFETPAPGTAIAHKAGAALTFQVNEQKLAPDDVQAGVESVRLLINGREVTGVRADAAGRYSYQLDLSDTALYPATLEALQVEVRASNGRSPEPAVQSAVLEVPVDGQGPEIRVTRPKDATFVGQLAEVVARITDDVAGIQESSVRVTVSVDDIADAFPMTMGGSEQEFVASFPTAKYEARAQLTLNVIAEDKAGNETRVSSVVFVDSVPPWVSLDPPSVRLLTEHSERGIECSAPFDPVGDDAIDDLSVVDSLFARYRVLAWERGIVLDGQSIVHLSDVDKKSVALFVQGNPAIHFTQLRVVQHSGRNPSVCGLEHVADHIGAAFEDHAQRSPLAQLPVRCIEPLPDQVARTMKLLQKLDDPSDRSETLLQRNSGGRLLDGRVVRAQAFGETLQRNAEKIRHSVGVVPARLGIKQASFVLRAPCLHELDDPHQALV